MSYAVMYFTFDFPVAFAFLPFALAILFKTKQHYQVESTTTTNKKRETHIPLKILSAFQKLRINMNEQCRKILIVYGRNCMTINELLFGGSNSFSCLGKTKNFSIVNTNFKDNVQSNVYIRSNSS